MSKMLTKNGWNIRIDGSREVWVYNVLPSTLPSGNGNFSQFVARFKYMQAKRKANTFVKFLTSNFTPAERSDMSVDIEKYRREIAELKSELNETQRAGVTTANYWKDRAELAEDQRERTRDVWATRAERAEAKVARAERIIAAADAIRHSPSGSAYDDARKTYDRERAEWKQ